MSAPMTPERARELLDAATPGPWELDGVRPHTAHVWPVDGSDDPITGEIDIDNAHLIAATPDIARAYLAEHEARVAAEAAQALVLEQAADSLLECSVWCDSQELTDAGWHNGVIDARKHHMARILALASDAGVEALAALRAERDEAKRLMQARHREMLAADDLMRKHQRRAEAAEAERDTLAAQVEALRAVKPLEWERHPAGWIAAPPTGRAYIIDVRMKGRVMFVKGIEPSPQFDDTDAAKAAAQADYEARILSALKARHD